LAALFCALAVLPEFRFRMRAKSRTTTCPSGEAPRGPSAPER
jgi:hypothetical protein